jgi:hypothetical protein
MVSEISELTLKSVRLHDEKVHSQFYFNLECNAEEYSVQG